MITTSTNFVKLSAFFVFCLFAANSVYADTEFIVDSSASSIRIITDKSGVASAAAHQHVVAIKNINGRLSLNTNTAVLSMRPEGFIVDSPEDRVLFPEVFNNDISESAVKGTLKNMLGRKLLNAAKYPLITVDLTLFELNGENAVLDAVVNIQERKVPLKLTAIMSHADKALRVKSMFSLSNKDLGLKVFTAFFGSIAVGKKLVFYVDITAVRE